METNCLKKYFLIEVTELCQLLNEVIEFYYLLFYYYLLMIAIKTVSLDFTTWPPERTLRLRTRAHTRAWPS